MMEKTTELSKTDPRGVVEVDEDNSKKMAEDELER